MRTFVVGDIHGNYRALKQCIERSGFDKEKDRLISLGDIADGWPEVFECVEELLTIKNLITIRGNHDDWFYSWLIKGRHPDNWIQGGEGTLASYTESLGKTYTGTGSIGFRTDMSYLDIPDSHMVFWTGQKPYYKDENNNLFIHGGFNRHYLLKDHKEDLFWWDRDLFMSAMSADAGGQKLKFKEEFNNIYIGHTETRHWDKTFKPMFVDRVINVDQGAGWNGKLTIMDINTKEYWQSDDANSLYPEEKIRR